MPITTQQRPGTDRRHKRIRDRVPYALNARLSHEQHAYLEDIAAVHDVGLSEALRIVLDDAMQGAVSVMVEDVS